MVRHFLNLKLWLAGAVLFAAGGSPPVLGQAVATNGSGAVLPPKTVEGALHEMSDAAGVIFAGQVLRVHQLAGSGGGPGVVEVTFRVDQAVKGCGAGGTYVLREWAGLWNGGDARYRVGQRLLMLLRAPGVAGMSSPVGGMDGAIPILGGVTEIAGPRRTEASAASVVANGAVTGAGAMVDLRWVGARMLRDAPYMAPGTGTGEVSATSVEAGVGASGTGSAGSVAAAGASVATVMGMLGSWEAERAAQ